MKPVLALILAATSFAATNRYSSNRYEVAGRRAGLISKWLTDDGIPHRVVVERTRTANTA